MTDHDPYDAGKEKGLIMGKLETLEVIITDVKKSLNEFKIGTGQRVGEVEKVVGDHTSKIGILDKATEDLVKAKNWVVGTVVGAVILAIMGWVLQKR